MTTHDPIEIKYTEDDITITVKIENLTEDQYLKFGNEKYREDYFNKVSELMVNFKSIL